MKLEEKSSGNKVGNILFAIYYIDIFMALIYNSKKVKEYNEKIYTY